MSRSNVNSVFYADTYHPIQAGSIDGTDTLPHDNAVYRALLCSSAGLYDPFGDPKIIGDPYCTVFIGSLSRLTTEDSLLEAMSKYGTVRNLRLVRDIVTGASRGYAFVEYETEREMKRAYKDAHHSRIDDHEIIVDYNRQQLMPGWIPRRLGGGLGGRKESGQLRFGGRERPFRAPLRPVPYDDLKRLGIPPPPEGRYMSRFQVPSPPRRKSSSMEREERFQDEKERRKVSSMERGEHVQHNKERRRRTSMGKEECFREEEERRKMSSEERGERIQYEKEQRRKRTSMERAECFQDEGERRKMGSVEQGAHIQYEKERRKRTSVEREERFQDEEERRKLSSAEQGKCIQHEKERRRKRTSAEREECFGDEKERSHHHHKHKRRSHRHERSGKTSASRDRSSDVGSR